MTHVLSIDLGTTYSAAAVAEGTRVEIFSLGTQSPTIPSVVGLGPDGTVLIGEAAERRAVSEPARVAREFKRRLGDPVPIVIGGTPYGAEALMAHLLRWIVDRVAEQEGALPHRVVLTHPASYGPYKLDLLRQVGHLAAIEPLELVAEPQAAAMHYARQERVEPGEVVAVYDLGGGTFDAALVRRTADGFELIGTPDGMDRFGGIDLDEAVFAHVRSSLGRALDALDPDDSGATTALARLRDDCRRAKESLSADTEVVIPVMLPSLHTEVRLTRAEFEDMIRPRLRETLATLDRVLRSANLQWRDVSRVLLVGGSSRIPLVGEMVRAHTARPTALDAHPKHAIALGAAAGAVDETGVVVSAAGETPGEAARRSAAETPSSPEPARGMSEPAPTVDRRRPAWIVIGSVGLAVVTLLAVLAFVFLGGDGGDEVAPDRDHETGSVPVVVPSDAPPDETASPAATEPASTEPMEAVLPPVDGEPPSDRVLAYYVAGYTSQEVRGGWSGWADAPETSPPTDIASDFWPVLGPYDSTSPEVVAQHLAWLRRAGVGGVVVRWRLDDPAVTEVLPLLLELGGRYEIRLVLSVPMEDDAPDETVARVEQLLAQFGEHPQYLRVGVADRDGRESARPLLVLEPRLGAENPEVWAGAITVIRGLGEGVAVVVATGDPVWAELTPADGLLGGPNVDGDYGWSTVLPEAVWYLPAVRPGMSVERLGEPTSEDREEGARLGRSWQLAREAREPTFFVIDSFNDWVLGTQIEPAASDVPERPKLPYRTYAPLGPDTYLDITRELVDTSAR